MSLLLVNTLESDSRASISSLDELGDTQSLQGPALPESNDLAFQRVVEHVGKDPFVQEIPLFYVLSIELQTLFYRCGVKIEWRDKFLVPLLKNLYRVRSEQPRAKNETLAFFQDIRKFLNDRKGIPPVDLSYALASIERWEEFLKSSTMGELFSSCLELKRTKQSKQIDVYDHPVFTARGMGKKDYTNYQTLLAFRRMEYFRGILILRMVLDFRDSDGKEKDFALERQIQDPVMQIAMENFLSKQLKDVCKMKPRYVIEFTRYYTQYCADLFSTFKKFFAKGGELSTFDKGFYETMEKSYEARATEEGPFIHGYMEDHQALIREFGSPMEKRIDFYQKWKKEMDLILSDLKENLAVVANFAAFIASSDQAAMKEICRRGNSQEVLRGEIVAFSRNQKDPVYQREHLKEQLAILTQFKAKAPGLYHLRQSIETFLRDFLDFELTYRITIEEGLELLRRSGAKLIIDRSSGSQFLGATRKERKSSFTASSLGEEVEEPESSDDDEIDTALDVQQAQKAKPPINGEDFVLNLEATLMHALRKAECFSSSEVNKEAFQNAKVHLANFGIFLVRFINRQTLSKAEQFFLMAGAFEEANLCVEQILFALHIHKNKISTFDEAAPHRSHYLNDYMEGLAGFPKSGSDFVSRIDGIGLFTRDIGAKTQRHANCPIKRLLVDLYYAEGGTEEALLQKTFAEMVRLSQGLYGFCKDVAAYAKVKENVNIKGWAAYCSQLKAPISEEKEKTVEKRGPLYSIKAKLLEIRQDRFPGLVENVLYNTMLRLEEVVSYLQDRRPKESWLLFSSGVFLSHLIAEQVMEVCLLDRHGECNRKDYDHDIERMSSDLGKFAFTAEETKFLQRSKESRTMTRYPWGNYAKAAELSSFGNEVIKLSSLSKTLEKLPEGFSIVTPDGEVELAMVEAKIMEEVNLLAGILGKVMHTSVSSE